MTELIRLLIAVSIVIVPLSLFVFAVAKRDNLPLLFAIFYMAVLGLHYCQMKVPT